MARTRKKASSPASKLSGAFGFDPGAAEHHFAVHISRSNSGFVEISEYFAWSEAVGSTPVSLAQDREEGQLRVRLPRPKWDEIADPVRSEFNQRLRKAGKSAGKWKIGSNLVGRILGKELVLLAWAIEDADPALVPTAVSNWLGLSPEERWWLYTMTAAATGHAVIGRGRGWRKAVRFALTENPVVGLSDRPIVPEFFRLVAEMSDG